MQRKSLFETPIQFRANGHLVVIIKPEFFRKEEVLDRIYPSAKFVPQQAQQVAAEIPGVTSEFNPRIKRQVLMTINKDGHLVVIPLTVTPFDLNGKQPAEWLQTVLPEQFQWNILRSGIAVSEEVLQGEELMDVVDQFERKLDLHDQAIRFTDVIDELCEALPLVTFGGVPAPAANKQTVVRTQSQIPAAVS